jgi:hemolysin activation/secretion protein
MYKFSVIASNTREALASRYGRTQASDSIESDSRRHKRDAPKYWLTIALLVISPCGFAQQQPSAGSQLQQIPPPPASPRAAPEFRIDQAPAPVVSPASDTGVKILVNALRVTGSSVYSEGDLISLTGFHSGSSLSLADLQVMAARITDYYRQHGYFVAQAYLPAQDIKDSAVTIAVTEGRYGAVSINNHTNLSTGLATGLLSGLNSGDVISAAPLETRLLLLSDVPGVDIRSTLVPGTSPGASDLLVDIKPGRRVTGSVDADNAGNRYTGEFRVGATVNINNPLGFGDVLSLRAFTSGSGLKYGRASYQAQMGRV